MTRLGDGASAGVGVLTHDLGLPGYLARNVSVRTGRATDVDIEVSTTMTASSCLAALESSRLSRYDLVILSLGVNESLGFESVEQWATELAHVLHSIGTESTASTEVVVLSITYFSTRALLPRVLSHLVDRRAAQMNARSERVVSEHDRVHFVWFAQGEDIESDGAHAYERWARGIAPTVADLLAPSWSVSLRTELADEQGRQEALDALGLLDMPPDPLLDEIATTARDLFGTPFAGVTFIDTDRQSMAAAIGLDARDMNRTDAFCDVTIRRTDHFVIEDAVLDPRYADNPMSPAPRPSGSMRAIRSSHPMGTGWVRSASWTPSLVASLPATRSC